ncbi:hypothetical protein NOR53_2426 [gamma proteobacterium NOR5-3]|nr:hypothetical protein NOR53_2426 [gamma proteobacterium NOR5-3]
MAGRGDFESVNAEALKINKTASIFTVKLMQSIQVVALSLAVVSGTSLPAWRDVP